MPDLLYDTLVVCLVLSNLNRIIWAVKTIYEYLTRPRAPQLVPYFDENGKSNIQTGSSGNLIGMVRVPVDALERLRGNDPPSATEIPAIDNFNAPATTPDDTAAAAARRKSKSDLAVPRLYLKHRSPGIAGQTDLGTNWVMETTRTKGSSRAKNWLKGRETRRRCLGAIKCQGPNCSMHLVPAARKIERYRQLEEKCVECRSNLTTQSCNVETSLFQFAEGFVFVNYGVHTHTTFTHSTALKPDGSLAFADFNPRFQVRTADTSPNAPVVNDSESDHSNDANNDANEANTAHLLLPEARTLSRRGSSPVSFFFSCRCVRKQT
ncbi:hypothetical protein R3P38DRAFT_2813851 [Favolaschia claudopus]|uniref:Uncharacterized protein n=1 Tax=Favolaschia claudopus TaxID=2862362 RepID=A0AAV9Z4F7_9AGAR